MRADWNIRGICWMGLLAGLVMGGSVFAQTAGVSPQTSGSADTLTDPLTEFQQQRQALFQQWQTLVSQGANDQQLQAWQQQNAPQFQALQQMAQALAAQSALEPMPLIQQVNIPPNASGIPANASGIPSNLSGTLGDFLTAQAGLANAYAQIHNQLLQALPSEVTQQQVTAMQQQEAQTFQQQNAADLQLQAQRAQALAAESASQPLPVPGPPVIPPGASPQLQAFLTARNALASDRAQLWNQYLTADPATRDAAMQQWQQQNAGSLQQLRALAQELSNSTATQEGTNQ
jgi:hypothetical protein